MLKRPDKEKLVKETMSEMGESKSVFFVSYKGTTVEQLFKVRKDLRKGKNILKVIKNRLVKIALKNKKIKYPDNFFKGQMITLFSKSNEIEPLKIVHKFFKENEVLEPKGGVFENKFIDKKIVTKLAKIPNREELQCKLVGTLNSPISGFVCVLRGNLQSLISVLNNITKIKN